MSVWFVVLWGVRKLHVFHLRPTEEKASQRLETEQDELFNGLKTEKTEKTWGLGAGERTLPPSVCSSGDEERLTDKFFHFCPLALLSPPVPSVFISSRMLFLSSFSSLLFLLPKSKIMWVIITPQREIHLQLDLISLCLRLSPASLSSLLVLRD